MQGKIIIAGLITILFFSIRGMISLILIIWGGKKVKHWWDRRKEKVSETKEKV